MVELEQVHYFLATSLLCYLVFLGKVGAAAVTVTLQQVTEPIGGDWSGISVENISPVGVGSDGGTTYVQMALASSFDVVYGTPPITTLVTDIQTETKVFVEQASWVFESYRDSSNKFNGYERNCTLPGQNETSECVVVFRGVGASSQVQTSTTTYRGQVAPWYTLTSTLPLQTSSGSRVSVLSLSPWGSLWLAMLLLR